MHCRRFLQPPLSRREMLSRCAGGFGAVALAAMLPRPAAGASGRAGATPGSGPFEPHPPHYPARARNVIFLFMEGGVSQVDTFDPKPLLDRQNGRPFGMKTEPTQFNNNGNVLASPWKFRRQGHSGTPVSDLFPHVGRCVDDLAVIRSMRSDFSEHAAANYFLHTGAGQQGRPSMGSWASYGLGSACQNLPAFVVLNGGKMPVGGPDNFNSGFLPAAFQGSIFRPGPAPVANITPAQARPQAQTGELALMRRLDARAAAARRGEADDQLESAVTNYEMAFRMQSAVPRVMDLAGETPATHRLYGTDSPNPMTRAYAECCLRARRLVEGGVRFVELTVPAYADDTWDAHQNLKANHEANAAAVDQPIAGLLADLKSRGLLDETLVVWSGEFGRTPFAQGSDGRDHNPFGFTVWLAGGGTRGGTVYGATDEYGYRAVEDACDVHDLHATMLHLLGIDHKRLTFRWGGRDMRLTDVHGEVIRGVLA